MSCNIYFFKISGEGYLLVKNLPQKILSFFNFNKNNTRILINNLKEYFEAQQLISNDLFKIDFLFSVYELSKCLEFIDETISIIFVSENYDLIEFKYIKSEEPLFLYTNIIKYIGDKHPLLYLNHKWFSERFYTDLEYIYNELPDFFWHKSRLESIINLKLKNQYELQYLNNVNSFEDYLNAK